MKTSKEKVSMLIIDNEQHQQLKIIAAKNGEKMRDLTQRIFKEFLEKHHD